MEGFDEAFTDPQKNLDDSRSDLGTAGSNDAADTEFLARADSWCSAALSNPDHREACLGAVSSGVAKIVHSHQRALECAIDDCKTNLLEEPAIQRALASHSGLLRQWQSLLNLHGRLERMRLDAEKLEFQRTLEPLGRTPR